MQECQTYSVLTQRVEHGLVGEYGERGILEGAKHVWTDTEPEQEVEEAPASAGVGR